MFHLTTSALLIHNETLNSPISFKVNAKRRNLDGLLTHLSHKRDVLDRAKYTDLLSRRGYDSISLEIVCPMCSQNQYCRHVDFYVHILDDHLRPVGHASPEVPWLPDLFTLLQTAILEDILRVQVIDHRVAALLGGCPRGNIDFHRFRHILLSL